MDANIPWLTDARKSLFSGTGNETKVAETLDPGNTNPREMQRSEWQARLNNFKSYTENA